METPNNSSANVNANFSIKPELSQSALITILLISCFSLAVGLFFLWHDKNYSWVPITISLGLIIISFIGWWRSQKMIDMGNSNPTHIYDSQGNKLITDTRTLESGNAIKNIGILFQSIGSRQPLPLPDGLIDEKGNLIPESRVDAENKINQINENLTKQTQDFVSNTFSTSKGVEQKAVKLPEEAFDGILDTNRSGSNDQL